MTDKRTPPAAGDARRDRSPFGAAAATPRGAASNVLLFAAVVVISAAAAWWFTRPPKVFGSPPRAADAHDSSASPVMLTADAARRIGVTYAVVERGTLAGEVRAVGLVSFDETRVKTIAPKVDGYVEQLFVAFTGQPVGVGDSLLRIYSPMLVTAQEELLLAKKLSLDVANGGAEAVRDADGLLAGARRRLGNWDVPDEDIARIERTGEVQKTLTLRSPIRGVVVQKNVSAGQRIAAGDALYQVADLREVWLEGDVFERDLSAVAVGERVTADIASMPGSPRTGRIVYVSPTVAADTRTAKVRVALPNADLALKPGMYASIRIQGIARGNVLSVPRSAVLATGTRALAFVKGADGTLAPREVVLGASTDDRVEILGGLAAGETVVSSATFLIDAESNLGSALAGMANMPGMDAKSPKAAPPPNGSASGAHDPMAGMPGMDGMGAPARKP